jgi:hypothetical protein
MPSTVNPSRRRAAFFGAMPSAAARLVAERTGAAARMSTAAAA